MRKTDPIVAYLNEHGHPEYADRIKSIEADIEHFKSLGDIAWVTELEDQKAEAVNAARNLYEELTGLYSSYR